MYDFNFKNLFRQESAAGGALLLFSLIQDRKSHIFNAGGEWGDDGGVVEGACQGSWESRRLTFDQCWCSGELLDDVRRGSRLESGTEMRGAEGEQGGFKTQIPSHTPGKLPECVSDKGEFFIHHHVA